MPNFIQNISATTRYAWFYAAYFAALGTTSIYITLYLQAIGFSGAQIATLLSLQLLLRIVIPNFWGHLADKTGGRLKLIRVSMLVSLLGVFGLFFTTAVLPVTILFLLINAMWAAVVPLFEAIVMAKVQGDTGRYALIRLWGSVGFIAAVSMTGPLLDWASVLALIPVVAVLLALAIAVAWMVTESLEQPPLARRNAESLLEEARILGVYSHSNFGQSITFSTLGDAGHGRSGDFMI